MPKRILIQYSMPCLPMQYGDSWEEKMPLSIAWACN